MKFYARPAAKRVHATGLLAAASLMLSACGGGGETQMQIGPETAMPSDASKTVAAAPATRPGRLPAWCGQTLTFDGNSLPANWSLNIVRGGPGIVDNRLSAMPTDSGAVVEAQAGALPAGTTQVLVSFDAERGYSYFGQWRTIELVMADGSVWQFGEGHAAYRMAPDSRQFAVSHNSVPFNVAGENFYYDEFLSGGFGEFQTGQRTEFSVINGLVSWTLVDAGGRTQTVTRPLPAPFAVADITSVHVLGYTTTDSGTWIDNISIQCLRGRAPAL